MRKILITTFVTLDGVMQAPGGPEEDPTGDFKYGGWSFHYWDDSMGTVMDEFISKPFELLLGRKTYDIFAAHWPHVKNEPIADKFNSTKKYVVSNSLEKTNWNNSFIVNDNVIEKIKDLKKENGPELQVHGSSNFIQTLIKNNLVDEYHVWTFPITVGNGKRLFGDGTIPINLKLIKSKTSSTGVIMSVYEPAGEIKIGSFALDNPEAAELERRIKMKNEN
jgi:dihydrofolate reductase